MSNRLQAISGCISQKLSNNPEKDSRDVYIVAAKRTPIGSYMGKLSSFKGSELAGLCIKSALSAISLNPN
jgi:hypothetical protein